MNHLARILFVGLMCAAVLSGCKKTKGKVPGSTEKTKTVRMDTVIERPKNFESIHELELKQHNAAAAGDTTKPKNR